MSTETSPTTTNFDVSVVIPAYQAEEFIERAILSATSQTLAPREIIVIDDGSSDGMAEKAEIIGKDLIGIEFTLLRQDNLGAGAARNAGIMAARGQYVAFLDADDEWLPKKLERSWQHLRQPGVEFVAHDYVRDDGDRSSVIDCTRHFRQNPDPFVAYFLRGYIATSTVVVRRELLVEAGGFDPSLQSGQDYEMWLVLISSPDIQHEVFSEALTRYHVTRGSITSQIQLRRDAAFEILRRHLRRLEGHCGNPGWIAVQRTLIINMQTMIAHYDRQDIMAAAATLLAVPWRLFWTWRILVADAVERPNYLNN